MTRDSFDMFNRPERGRFGDNESQEVRGNDSVRSDLVDLKMAIHMERPRAVLASLHGDITQAKWLPRSQVEITDTGGLERKKNGRTVQPCEITLPRWLAKEKGLI